ncbi:MAG: hypothetical protein A4E33_01692 [Methanoregula sp. PtaB.Bin085]|nr:MAG: hypothetical protein A4E33_01692 [Methanoregula sp. PtaB.Bin085]
MFIDYFSGALLQGNSPPVISHPLPYEEDISEGCGCKCSEIRKGLHECREFTANTFDLRLLEHDFGDHDGVGIRSLSPGEIPPVKPVIIKNGFLECLH